MNQGKSSSLLSLQHFFFSFADKLFRILLELSRLPQIKLTAENEDFGADVIAQTSLPGYGPLVNKAAGKLICLK